MLKFKTLRYKNFLATGNAWNTYVFDKHPHTLIVGSNGAGKCFCLNTRIKVRNRHTGEILELTVGEFYAQAQQNAAGQD